MQTKKLINKFNRIATEILTTPTTKKIVGMKCLNCNYGEYTNKTKYTNCPQCNSRNIKVN